MCKALDLLDTLLSISGPPIPDKWAAVAYELHTRLYSDLAIHQTVRCLGAGYRVEELAWVAETDRAGVREAAERGLLAPTTTEPR